MDRRCRKSWPTRPPGIRCPMCMAESDRRSKHRTPRIPRVEYSWYTEPGGNLHVRDIGCGCQWSPGRSRLLAPGRSCPPDLGHRWRARCRTFRPRPPAWPSQEGPSGFGNRKQQAARTAECPEIEWLHDLFFGKVMSLSALSFSAGDEAATRDFSSVGPKVVHRRGDWPGLSRGVIAGRQAHGAGDRYLRQGHGATGPAVATELIFRSPRRTAEWMKDLRPGEAPR
jgi:hypothetical protein